MRFGIGTGYIVSSEPVYTPTHEIIPEETETVQVIFKGWTEERQR